jgi:hypothetical protein
MKPRFKHNVKTTHGIDRKEDLVYCEYNEGELIIAKHLPQRPLYNSNISFGNISTNLRLLYETLSPDFKQDLSSYTMMYRSVRHNPHKIAISSYSIFTKMIWNLKKQMPEIDLLILCRNDILKNEYPVRTVAEAMKTGLLLKIEEAMILDHLM